MNSHEYFPLLIDAAWCAVMEYRLDWNPTKRNFMLKILIGFLGDEPHFACEAPYVKVP